VDLLLEPGDALIADNAVVMHNRSAYVDSADHTRCMVRAWAKA
jgi:alpha-ketoglutarate-dependent taurine dioxygenase